MVRRHEIFGIGVISTICLLYIIVFNQKEEDYNTINKSIPHSPRFESLFDEDNEVNTNHNYSPSIRDIVNYEEMYLKHSLRHYKFPPRTNYKNYSLAYGGQPVRTVIVTTWRSGSTFLGDVLNSVPGNYYHYEPLLDYGIIQIRGPPYSESALRNLKNLLNCNYNNLQNYLDYGKSHIYLFTHNTRLWRLCERYPQFCWNSTFLNEICKIYPFQSMKTVRLRLRLAEELLKDENLNVKVALLVRDPRGTLQSRKHRDWCPGAPDCDKPNLLCADMVADYSAAIQFQKLYPNKFRAIRYEDLSLNPFKHVRSLFKFFGLYFHREVEQFLNSHTKMNVGGVSSTFRDSKIAPFHWKMDLNYSEVQYIEENCEEAMKLWGYLKANNETNLREFNPLGNYNIN